MKNVIQIGIKFLNILDIHEKYCNFLGPAELPKIDKFETTICDEIGLESCFWITNIHKY